MVTLKEHVSDPWPAKAKLSDLGFNTRLIEVGEIELVAASR